MPFRIALYSGVYVERDGIGGAIACRLALLDRLRRAGAEIEAAVFCRGSDIDDDRVRVLGGVAELLLDPFFRTADLHAFEFGVRYDLFDALFALPAGAASLVTYHNVTPPDLVPPDRRADVEASLAQRHNLFAAGHVACVSEFNRRDLLALGVPGERMSVVPCPTPAGRLVQLPEKPMAGSGRTVEFLFVGRFVRAKGVVELLEAADLLAASDAPPFRLTLVFNRAFSDPGLLSWFDARGPRPWLRVQPDASDRALAAAYAAADCLVIPSYHEGFCVPVIEALSAGCQVIAADAANLPFILDGLGLLVPPGDAAALAGAMRGVAEALRAATSGTGGPLLPTDRGPMPAAMWTRATQRHLRSFSREAFESGFARALRASLAAAGRIVPDWLLPGYFERLAGILSPANPA